MARPAFASGQKFAIVPSPAARAVQDLARCRSWAAAAREITTMATSYQGNVTPQVPAAQDSAAGPVIRTIGLSDLHRALRLGWEDFKAVPSHAIILCVIYPVLGLMLARAVSGYAVFCRCCFRSPRVSPCSARSQRSVFMS
jgi:hypothetical protein